jgi:hypothetical protein
LQIKIPPSTLSNCFKKTDFSQAEKQRIILNGKARIKAGTTKTIALKTIKRELRRRNIIKKHFYLKNILEDPDVSKIALVALYLCEGSKRNTGSLCFGNSNSQIIALFLRLFRMCYPVDEKKFRCTVQCRADQNQENLTLFWSKITDIPLAQFYQSRVDKRSIGLPTKKVDYKGVCRIDYFSSAIYNELKIIGEML